MNLFKYIFLFKKEGHAFFAMLAIALIAGYVFNQLLGLAIALLAVLYFGIALYAAVLDYAHDKELFYAASVDAWAKQGGTPEEVKRRQQLIATSGAAVVFENELFEDDLFSFEDYVYSSTTEDSSLTYSSPSDLPIYDVNSPFSAMYGDGGSNYEIMTGMNQHNSDT